MRGSENPSEMNIRKSLFAQTDEKRTLDIKSVTISYAHKNTLKWSKGKVVFWFVVHIKE